MKKILLTLTMLLSVFFTSWAVKVHIPVARPDNTVMDYQTPWYAGSYSSPVASDDWKLDNTIPDNYVPVPGQANLFMVVDDDGTILKYRTRTQQPDGTWVWKDTNPDIPENYEPVDGLKDVYKVTLEDGTVVYKKYIRNADDTYAFIDVDENGNPIDLSADAQKIDEEHYKKEEGNIYRLYDDNGVLVGYRERVDDGNGGFEWKEVDPPKGSLLALDDAFGKSSLDTSLPDLSVSMDTDTVGYGPSVNINVYDYGQVGGQQDMYDPSVDEPSVVRYDNADGTYTEREKTINTYTENGQKVTEESEVITVYDNEGSVLTTKEEGPFETKRETLKSSNGGSANPSLVADTLDGEYSRVGSKVTYNTGKAAELLANLNADRSAAGLAPIRTSDTANKLAAIRAADMCIYDHNAQSSPVYGTIDDMVSRWGISCGGVGENIYKTTNKNASQIDLRLQSDETSRNTRMSGTYTSVGIAICERDGQSYIAEIFLY